MCLLFFTPLFLRLVPAAAVGGLGPVEFPFQILFLGDLALPELFLAKLPLLQEIVQQAIPEADRHVLFREIRVGGVCDLIEPGAGVTPHIRACMASSKSASQAWKSWLRQTVHACPSLPVLCVILYKTKRNPGPSESFDFERVLGFV